MRDPIILRRTEVLSPKEASYWKDLLYRVTKIGSELEVAPPKGVKRAVFEEAVRKALAPSGCLDRLGANGVLDVQAEHCGIEIRVIGRHPHFLALQRQYENITQVLYANKARPRSTCGLHFHMLTPGLAEPLPEIILANVWNLTRRYAPALKFITSGGKRRDALCRRRNHNSHRELVHHSPGTMTMAEIQRTLRESKTVPEHQNFLNLEHLGFTENGNVLPFHLEFRLLDTDLSPTSITAKTFLFLAILLKSVDLSQYGVIHVGKTKDWRRKIGLLDMLNNNNGSLATSDTSRVTDEVIEELRQDIYELLDLLTPTFERFGDDNPALEVLFALAERPISLLRCSGYDWVDIEKYLAKKASTEENLELDEIDRNLMRHIEFGEWVGLPSKTAWQCQAADELLLSSQELKNRMNHLKLLRGLRWDMKQGSFIFRS